MAQQTLNDKEIIGCNNGKQPTLYPQRNMSEFISCFPWFDSLPSRLRDTEPKPGSRRGPFPCTSVNTAKQERMFNFNFMCGRKKPGHTFTVEWGWIVPVPLTFTKLWLHTHLVWCCGSEVDPQVRSFLKIRHVTCESYDGWGFSVSPQRLSARSLYFMITWWHSGRLRGWK